jgi:uncharacterized protein YyaL (SSP411 family)
VESLMKKIVILAMIALTVLSGISCAAGKKETPKAAAGSVFWLGWDQALAAADADAKVVDVYTEWCGWCKVMDEKTYSNQAVSELMRKSFVAVKLNAEGKSTVSYMGKSYTETELARSLNVNGYPTTIFLGSDGSVLEKASGYIEAPMFKRLLEYFDSDSYKSMSLDQYFSGKQ